MIAPVEMHVWPAALQYYELKLGSVGAGEKKKKKDVYFFKSLYIVLQGYTLCLFAHRKRRAEQLNALDHAASHACLCAYNTNSKMIKHAEEQTQQRKWQQAYH